MESIKIVLSIVLFALFTSACGGDDDNGFITEETCDIKIEGIRVWRVFAEDNKTLTSIAICADRNVWPKDTKILFGHLSGVKAAKGWNDGSCILLTPIEDAYLTFHVTVDFWCQTSFRIPIKDPPLRN